MKDTSTYYLDIENKTWLAESAKQKQRSASWYLNDLLTKARESEQVKHGQ